ncbi:hypothetical protein Bca4012_102758 [Brassica carinata]
MRDEPEAGYGAQLRANLEPTKGVGRLRQRGGGHGSRNPLRIDPKSRKPSDKRLSRTKGSVKIRNRGVAVGGSVRESEASAEFGKSYLFCLTACPPWKRLSGRVSGWKSTAASRGVGAFRPLKIRRTECAHAGRTHNASGLQVRTRRLLAGCLSASVASGPPRVGGGGLGAALRELSRASNSQLRTEMRTRGIRLALNVKVKKFNQARVNGGSNYDSLKRNHSQESGLGRISGKEDPVELDSSPTL